MLGSIMECFKAMGSKKDFRFRTRLSKARYIGKWNAEMFKKYQKCKRRMKS